MEMVENFKEAFSLFDKGNKSVIDVPNLGRVMRYVRQASKSNESRRDKRQSETLKQRHSGRAVYKSAMHRETAKAKKEGEKETERERGE